MFANRSRTLIFCAAFWLCALAGALVILGGPPAEPVAAGGAGGPAFAPNVITGTVFWKETGEPVAGVHVVASDPNSHEVVATADTDLAGMYMLLVGVGTWLVEVPSGKDYFGYGQLLTVLPHVSYILDFSVTSHPPEAPKPTAAPTLTPAPGSASQPAASGTPGSGSAGTTPSASATHEPSTLPKSGIGSPGSEPALMPQVGFAAGAALFGAGMLLLLWLFVSRRDHVHVLGQSRKDRR